MNEKGGYKRISSQREWHLRDTELHTKLVALEKQRDRKKNGDGTVETMDVTELRHRVETLEAKGTLHEREIAALKKKLEAYSP